MTGKLINSPVGQKVYGQQNIVVVATIRSSTHGIHAGVSDDVEDVQENKEIFSSSRGIID